MTIGVLKQSYVDLQTAELHPDAVWYPQSDQRDNKAMQTGLTWYCYLDAQRLADGHAPVGQHSTQVPRALMLSAAQQVLTAPITQQEAAFRLYLFMAKTVLDTPALNPDGSPQLDANNQPVMVAFFANASPMMVTVPDTWGA